MALSMRYLYWSGLTAIVLASVFFASNTYYLYIIGTIAITTLVGVGLNILTGLSGQVSIGHAGIFAIGAYTGSLLMKELQLSFWLAAIVAAIVAGVTGIALATPALRVKGPYLAMVTIAFGIIIERVLIEWVDLTGGFGGIYNIPKPTLLNLQPALRDVVLIAWIAAICALLAFAFIKDRAWGLAWQAVRDDEVAAAAVGLNVLKVRTVAFAVSAAVTGLGGVFFASVVGFISPNSFTFHRSIIFLLVVILGGLGTTAGSLIGAIALVILPELLGDFAEYQLLVFGILLLLTLWLTPEGVASFFARRFNRHQPIYPPEMSSENLPASLAPISDLSLEVSNIAISFGGIKAVDGVSLVAESETITSIIGANGAGKTTLLNLLTGFYTPEAGNVRLGNLELTAKDTSELVSKGLSRTFQTTRLFDSLSVLNNLKVSCGGDLSKAVTIFGRNKQSLTSRLTLLLAFVGYRGDINARADSLSFGDRRLVEIARALATTPRVLLLDEPAAGLSQQQRSELAKLLRRLANAGIAVIVIEHDMNLVMDISDRIVVLDRGKVISEGTVAKVQSDRRVLDAYLGISSDKINSSTNTTLQSLATSPILAVEDLVAGYGELQILQKVSLEVRQRELVAVIGANGAGKTTLLKSIARLLTPRSGRLLWRGENLTKLPPQQLAKKGVVLVPEGRQVFTQLSVIDNLRLGAFQRRDNRIDADIEAMLVRFPPLKPLAKQPAGLLSGGEQQMLAIARGLMAKPQILLLDEPSLGLAPQLVASLYQTLASLCEEGISILLVDQMAQSAFSVAHRLYVLETGRIVKTGTVEELRHDSAIVSSYLGNSLRS